MLYIAEKPSVARAIAEQLQIKSKSDGFIICANDTVTWCFGHLLELAEPDSYLPENVPIINDHKKWRWEDLPIIPKTWILEPKKECKKQIGIIKKLLSTTDTVVNCGDPDREGQLLIDELLEYLHYSGNVKRYWCNAVDSTSIKRALSTIKNNSDYQGMKKAAEARSRADWLVGMNMSRAYTLAARHLVTVGRVQSPTLKLVADRDIEISRFQPRPYFQIKVRFKVQEGEYIGNLITDGLSGTDPEGRLINTDEVRKIITSIKDQSGVVKSYSNEPKAKKPPLGLSLSDVQAKASASWGYSADAVLSACQSLYEKKLTTYPRTDCNYLPESQNSDAVSVMKAIASTAPELKDLTDNADINIKTKIWNDSKTTAHHAIIPTMQAGDITSLSPAEQNIYKLIAKYYIANFYPDYEFFQTEIITEIGDYQFRSSGHTVKAPGWKNVVNEVKESKDDASDDQVLPRTNSGENAENLKSGYKEQMTKAPSKFTEGSLIKAMENIYKYIEDPEMKKLLKDGDGIGTSATRASIIADLKKRKFLESKGKFLVSTEVGRSVISTIPAQFSSPVMTAIFERILKKIEEGTATSEEFLKMQIDTITREISKINGSCIKLAGLNKNVSKIYRCMECGGGLIRRKGKNGYFWGCEKYPECKKTYPDKDGKPEYTKSKK